MKTIAVIVSLLVLTFAMPVMAEQRTHKSIEKQFSDMNEREKIAIMCEKALMSDKLTNEEKAFAYCKLGSYLKSLGEENRNSTPGQMALDKAVKCFENGIKYDSSFREIYEGLYDTWHDRGNKAEELKALNLWIANLPNDPKPYEERADYYLYAYRNNKDLKYDLVIADITKACELLEKKYKESGKQKTGRSYRDNRWDKHKLASMLFKRGQILRKTKDYQNTYKDFTAVVSLGEANNSSKREMAWFFSTCPDSKYRDGKLAIKLAKELIKDYKETYEEEARTEDISLLAAAYAADGNFKDAILTQKRAIENLTKSPYQTKDSKDAFKKTLKGYEQNKICTRKEEGPFDKPITLPITIKLVPVIEK